MEKEIEKMPRVRKVESRVPRFHSREEEAQFWETHSPMDFPEHWEEAEKTKVESPLNHTLAVRLDAVTIDKLAAISRKMGIGPSTLARMWLLERLSSLEEPRRGQTKVS